MKKQQSKLKYIDKDVLWAEYPELIFNVSYINEHFEDLKNFVEKYNIPGITNGKIFIYENLEDKPDLNNDIIKNVLDPLGFTDKKDYFSTQFYNKTRKEKKVNRAKINYLTYGFDWLICSDDQTGVNISFEQYEFDLDQGEYKSQVGKNNWGEHTFSNYKLADLESLDELPDINCWQITIVMRQEYIEGMNCNVLSHEGRIIWKESGGRWEFYDRFLELADMLQEKYGKDLMDFVPDIDWMSLYGDSISGVFQVHRCRMKIREKHRLVRKASREDIYEVALQELVEEERKKNPESFLNRWMNRLEEWNHNLEESEEKKINEKMDE